MNVFRTLIIPANLGPLAVAITDALGYPHKGMFAAEVEGDEVVGYISSGILDDDSPLLGGAEALHAAILAAEPGSEVTLGDCEQLADTLELTEADPHHRMRIIVAEIAAAASAEAWEPWDGIKAPYGPDAIVKHGGQTWVSTVANNVWEPGVSGWRLTWASTEAPPEWTQPTGAHDAIGLDELRSWQGSVYKSLHAANVWGPPPSFPALWELVA